MGHKRILSMALGLEDLWDRVEEQGYVWVKTKSGFITTDELDSYSRIKTEIYNVWLSQENYGKTWAFTKEELD